MYFVLILLINIDFCSIEKKLNLMWQYFCPKNKGVFCSAHGAFNIDCLIYSINFNFSFANIV